MINHVEIPSRFLRVASGWYCGQDDMLYAVCSSGGLYTGSVRPTDDDGHPVSDEQWYFDLWCALSCDVGRAVGTSKMAAAVSSGDERDSLIDEHSALVDFENWVDDTVIPGLEKDYGYAA